MQACTCCELRLTRQVRNKKVLGRKISGSRGFSSESKRTRRPGEVGWVEGPDLTAAHSTTEKVFDTI